MNIVERVDQIRERGSKTISPFSLVCVIIQYMEKNAYVTCDKHGEALTITDL